MGFEIKENLDLDILYNLILEEIKKEELIKIETFFFNTKEVEVDSLLSQRIARLKSSKPRQEVWRIYLKVHEVEDYLRKESYWLEVIYKKLGLLARPLTFEELVEANYNKSI